MTQELTIRQQITAKLRVRFAALIIGASLSAVALYMAMTYQMNRHQLARSLEMSHRVLTQALETSDLNLATTYLRATVEQESFYMIELRDTITHKSVLGPVTSDHRRYIELCGKTDMGSKYGVEIYACRRLLGFPEILYGFIILLTLGVVLVGGIRFINDELMDWSDKLSGVLDQLSSLGTDDLKEAEQNYRADVTQAKEVLDLRKRVVEILANSIKLIEHEATAKIATQVAHDIRSPLAALEVVSRNVAQLPEDKRILIRSAVGRIRDIANNLLDRHRAQASGAGVASEAASPQLLSSLIDPVVSEKRLQFRSQSRVEIELRLDASSYGHFAAVQAVEFNRLLSNLVNNAVEAFGEGSGTVSVGLSSRDGRALVSVQDNGKGIPPEVLAKLGRRGETHGKAGGSGLGLYHAQTSAESWGGSLEITSEVGKGTTTTVLLPLTPAPDWFVPELLLSPGKALVILDDDASIHQVWQGRLDALNADERGVEVIHVSTPEEIRTWVKSDPAKAREALFLFDYELQGYHETGLSLAAELALRERVVLVTSRYEEPEVLAGCRRLKARLLPKGLAGSVPMHVEEAAAETSKRERLDAVLIDDDALTRMLWENDASDLGKRLRTFSTAGEFLKEAGGIDRATPVYVDANLGEGVEGVEESRRIHEMGFGEVYLATGHEPGRFAQLKHLRGVIGKEPPWSA